MKRTEPAPKLRIGLFIARLPPEHLGGAELQADRLARELAARGHEVRVFARGSAATPRVERRDGVRIHRRPVLLVPGLRLAGEVFWAAWQAGRRDLDVLLCFMTFNSGLLGYAAHLVRRRPFVIWQRSLTEARLQPRTWLTRLTAFLNARAAGIWVQSTQLAQFWEHEFARTEGRDAWDRIASRVRVIGNAIDLPDPPPDEPPPPRFLFVGRLVWEKDLSVLVEASRSLRAGEIWIAGDGPLRDQLQAAAAGAPVRFLGKQPHGRISELLRQSRALVLCSKEEGFPNVVLEALAHSRPVVATPVGGIPEMVQDGVNGRLVPVNDPRALCAALEGLLDDDAWSRLMHATRPSVVRFSWPELVAQVESELRDIVAHGR
jgi:glycosyltransferase involved in cell wall biosynthesis